MLRVTDFQGRKSSVWTVWFKQCGNTEKLYSKSRDKIWLTMIGSACKSLPSLLHALTHFGEGKWDRHPQQQTHLLPGERTEKSARRRQFRAGKYQLHSSSSADIVLFAALTKGVALGIFCSSLTMTCTILLQNELLRNTKAKKEAPNSFSSDPTAASVLHGKDMDGFRNLCSIQALGSTDKGSFNE